MRLANSIAWAALGALAVTVAESSFAAAALINVPALYSCEPADIRVLAKGNYTIEGRDSDSHKLVFRARVDKGVNLVTWDSVDLIANATAIITVTDQTTPKQTALVTASAIVQPNPSGNTTCLRQDDKSHATAKQKNMVATIIGIVLAAFVALVLLLVGGMMYRRKKEKAQKFENESLDLNHGMPQAGVPAGGSYMARLVPGLKLQEARPLPRDPVLESEQANYASTRRGTQYYYTNARSRRQRQCQRHARHHRILQRGIASTPVPTVRPGESICLATGSALSNEPAASATSPHVPESRVRPVSDLVPLQEELQVEPFARHHCTDYLCFSRFYKWPLPSSARATLYI